MLLQPCQLIFTVTMKSSRSHLVYGMKDYTVVHSFIIIGIKIGKTVCHACKRFEYFNCNGVLLSKTHFYMVCDIF